VCRWADSSTPGAGGPSACGNPPLGRMATHLIAPATTRLCLPAGLRAAPFVRGVRAWSGKVSTGFSLANKTPKRFGAETMLQKQGCQRIRTAEPPPRPAKKLLVETPPFGRRAPASGRNALVEGLCGRSSRQEFRPLSGLAPSRDNLLRPGAADVGGLVAKRAGGTTSAIFEYPRPTSGAAGIGFADAFEPLAAFKGFVSTQAIRLGGRSCILRELENDGRAILPGLHTENL